MYVNKTGGGKKKFYLFGLLILSGFYIVGLFQHLQNLARLRLSGEPIDQKVHL